MTLDHSILGLENKFLETNQEEFFAFDNFSFTRSCQQIWGLVNHLLYFLYIASEVKQYYEALFLSYRPRTECSILQMVPFKIGFPTLTSDVFLNQKSHKETSHE